MMRFTLPSIVLASCFSLLCLLPVHAVEAPPASSNKGSIKNSNTKLPAANPGKASTPQKQSSSGFSFLVEPVPAWVTPVAAEPNPTPLPEAGYQLPLIDEQINLEGKTHQFRHVERRIGATAGLGRGAQIQVSFDPLYQELIFHHVTLLRDGKSIDKFDPKRVQLLQRETRLEARIYDGQVTASMVLDDVRVGDRIDYAYTLRGSNPVFGGKFSTIDHTGSYEAPTGLQQIRIVMPAGRTLQYRAPKAMQVSQQSLDGKQEWRFRQSAIPQRVREPNAPASSYLDELLQLSEYKDWNEVANWASHLFAPAATLADPVSQLGAKWRSGEGDEAQLKQVQLALDFVQKEIRYFGTELGTSSHKPALPEKVLAQRFGDCKDKSALLIALLKTLNIPARPALVSTYYHRDTSMMLPSPMVFNHAIVEVDVAGKKLWLDGTREAQNGPAMLRQSHQLGQVLVADPASTGLSNLPDTLQQVRKTVVDRFQLQNLTQTPLLVSTSTWYGDLAEYMRTYIARTPAAEVQAQLMKDLTQSYPGLKVKTPMKIEEVAGQNALTATLELNLPDFWTGSRLDTMTAKLTMWSLDETLNPPDSVRKTPYLIDFPGIYRHTIVAELGEDVLDVVKPEKFTDGQANFTLSGSSEISARRASWEAELRYLGHSVAPEQWRSFLDKAKQVRPRYHHVLPAHILDKKQIEALKTELKGLGYEAYVLRKVYNPKLVVLVTNAMLNSGRISPAMRGKVLVQRAHALVNFGFYDAAAADINAALDLENTDDADLLALAGLIAFTKQQTELAQEFVNKGYDLAPHEGWIHNAKQYIDYVLGGDKVVQKSSAGEPDKAGSEAGAGAGDDAEEKVVDEKHQKNLQTTLFKFLVAKRKGQDGKAGLKAWQAQEKDKKSWQYQLVQYYLGEAELNALVDRLNIRLSGIQLNPENLSMVYFFAAENFLLDGNATAADAYWKKAVATNTFNNFTYMASKFRLSAGGKP